MKNFKAGSGLGCKGNTESRRWSTLGCLEQKLSSKLNHFEMIKMFDQNKMFPLISLSRFGKRDAASASAMGKGWHCWSSEEYLSPMTARKLLDHLWRPTQGRSVHSTDNNRWNLRSSHLQAGTFAIALHENPVWSDLMWHSPNSPTWRQRNYGTGPLSCKHL